MTLKTQTRIHAIALDPFQESVYKAVPEVYTPPPKAPRYSSKFAAQAVKEYHSGQQATASMGPLKVHQSPPSDFLKKKKAVVVATPSTTTTTAPRAARKTLSASLIDGKKERKNIADTWINNQGVTETGSRPSKDFIKLNALDVINANAAKKGAVPTKYVLKKDYGQVPEYIQGRKSAIASSVAHAALAAQARSNQETLESGLILMPQEERIAMLAGLKANWEKLNLEYQKLSLTVDTVPKISRKVSLEQSLKNVEDYIKKFSNPNVMVNFNDAYA